MALNEGAILEDYKAENDECSKDFAGDRIGSNRKDSKGEGM